MVRKAAVLTFVTALLVVPLAVFAQQDERHLTFADATVNETQATELAMSANAGANPLYAEFEAEEGDISWEIVFDDGSEVYVDGLTGEVFVETEDEDEDYEDEDYEDEYEDEDDD